MIILTLINNVIKINFIKKTKLITICHLINLFTKIIKIKEIIINNQYHFIKIKINLIKTHNLIIWMSSIKHKSYFLFRVIYFLLVSQADTIWRFEIHDSWFGEVHLSKIKLLFLLSLFSCWKRVMLNVIIYKHIKHSNKHHLHPSIVFCLFIWDIILKLTQEWIKNHLYISLPLPTSNLSLLSF